MIKFELRMPFLSINLFQNLILHKIITHSAFILISNEEN